jgi:hypothetical protein
MSVVRRVVVVARLRQPLWSLRPWLLLRYRPMRVTRAMTQQTRPALTLVVAPTAVVVVVVVAEMARPRLESRVARLIPPASCGWLFAPALSLAA